MAKRGPKPRTASNRRKSPSLPVAWTALPCLADMTDGAKSEYFRLVEVLRRKGNLAKTDPTVVANLARIADLLDRAHFDLGAQPDLVITAGNGSLCANPLISIINSLSMRRRGLINDLGLAPASSKHADNVGGIAADDGFDGDPIAGMIKLKSG